MMPDQNSKPLLVSELVSNYKGINTSVISEETVDHGKNCADGSSQIIADYTDQQMPAG